MHNEKRSFRAVFGILCVLIYCTAGLYASTSDPVGASLLSQVTTNLNGAGAQVAQAEAGSPNWQVNPAAVGQSPGLFTYSSSSGSSTSFPNTLGSESGHADTVGSVFYGIPGGVATNVAHIDNYEANYFALTVVPTLMAINSPIVNQSFIFGASSVSEQRAIDRTYDNYAAQYRTLFVSGAGNSGPVSPPATCYNGIAVGAYGGSSSVGPTPDNGRAKPDVTAPSSVTSFSTPQVGGAAAVLLQAALRGDGGNNTNAAADPRTLKALLLNGAVKPADWAAPSPSPLDPRYGTGVLNVFNSYKQLAGGKHGYVLATTVPAGNPHPPPSATAAVSSLSGWDANTLTSSVLSDAVNHYFFNISNNLNSASFTATATLVWNRQLNQTSINQLALFLYDANTGSLLTSSTSAVDNVQHIFVPKLPTGRYDLQVVKTGGVSVSNAETYALAFEFFAMPLTIKKSGTNVLLTWPIYPDGFALESTPSLTSPTWTTVSASPTIVNNQNQVTLPSTSPAQFFRLRRP
jgi:hypothetical protein